MSERKAINKYYPPDYDPSLVPARKKARKNEQQTIKIRMMAPYLMRCLQCDEYIAQRRSFNARKQVTGEKYLNTKIIRFHITCPRCNNHISFKTDPKLAGYIPEEGAVRNYEPMQKKEEETPETEDEILARLEKEEMENKSFQDVKEHRKRDPFWQKQQQPQDKDVFLALQDRLVEQQRQQEITNHLESIQAKHSLVVSHGGAERIAQRVQESLKQADDLQEQAALAAFGKVKKGNGPENYNVKPIRIKKRLKSTDPVPVPTPLIAGYSSDDED